eukprot:TRINITY_DN3211_c0_g1_i1.p1 TRINITY_DN3211_c0_g1~~TRINITY_DN3211_c0_g1_i1.p1  ORF type:complete len:623 (+),score=187.89 TRINITY_DN3211_c0_g1_i1:179-2047(+)
MQNHQYTNNVGPPSTAAYAAAPQQQQQQPQVLMPADLQRQLRQQQLQQLQDQHLHQQQLMQQQMRLQQQQQHLPHQQQNGSTGMAHHVAQYTSNPAIMPQQQQRVSVPHQPPASVELVLLHQDAVEHESVTRHGLQMNVHAVVKNTIFKLEVGASHPHFNFFSAGALDAVLLYEEGSGGENDKPVDYVKVAPLNYQCRVAEKGEKVLIEASLSVLSSQHEDSFFRIRFSLPSGLRLYSHPIRVVSKPAQLRRKKEQPTAARGKKRTFTESVKDALVRLERTQRDQSNTLHSLFQALVTQNQILERHQPDLKRQRLLEPKTEPTSMAGLSGAANADEEEETTTDDNDVVLAPVPTKEEMKTTAQVFESHLHGLIEAFDQMAQQERVEVVRKVLKQTPNETMHKLSAVIDCISLEGLRREIAVTALEGAGGLGLTQDVPSLANSSDADLYKFCENFLSPMLSSDESTRSTNGNQHSSTLIPFLRRSNSSGRLARSSSPKSSSNGNNTPTTANGNSNTTNSNNNSTTNSSNGNSTNNNTTTTTTTTTTTPSAAATATGGAQAPAGSDASPSQSNKMQWDLPQIEEPSLATGDLLPPHFYRHQQQQQQQQQQHHHQGALYPSVHQN